MPIDTLTVAAEVNRRMAELQWNQVDLVRASGVSDTTVREIQAGRGIGRRHRSTLGKLAKALGWTPDSFDLIASGRSPQLVEELNVLRSDFDTDYARLQDPSSDITEHDLVEAAEDTDPRTSLRAIALLRHRLDELEDDAVLKAQVEGMPWSEVGRLLNRSKQTVWEKHTP